jgi:hypothetical protein
MPLCKLLWLFNLLGKAQVVVTIHQFVCSLWKQTISQLAVDKVVGAPVLSQLPIIESIIESTYTIAC